MVTQGTAALPADVKRIVLAAEAGQQSRLLEWERSAGTKQEESS